MAEIEAVKDGAITRVLINRVDQMNSITPDMHRSLQGVFDDFAADDSQYLAVVKGAGNRAFCAGSDLKSGIGKNYPEGGYAGLINRFDLPKPLLPPSMVLLWGEGSKLLWLVILLLRQRRQVLDCLNPKLGQLH